MPYGRICIDVSQRRNEYDWGIFPPLFPEIYRTYAVVVAGSSLLTGCGGDAPVQRAVGTSNRVLKVVSKLEQVECDATSDITTFKLVVTNGRNNALEVTKQTLP